MLSLFVLSYIIYQLADYKPGSPSNFDKANITIGPAGTTGPNATAMIDLWGFLRRRQIPSRVPTDEVLPVHVFDNVIGLRVPICLTLRFDEVLDAQKLVRSLARLAELGDWKKLGGRLRLNV